ncbi:GxxExxY protein [Caenimonas aquaedulcis]|uniref:GxxExxY protein n=1 Tax=Caenimonas aquaedulcis TaxID=2793270 RepID=A0A931MHP7_9BURK|nr:GxxExxY protein [Caenimonas aquaedulcis]MBG9389296.1 GxxExxY protein [Caenimonas aquaedulcis]
MSSPEFLNAEDAEVPQRAQRNSPVENDFSHEIIGAALEVQKALGTGLLESAYSAAFAMELAEREIGFAQEVAIPGFYKNRPLGVAFRADFIVENSVIVEIKAVDMVTELHRAQLLSYLRMANLKLGLLINFHVFPLVKGVHRLANKL